MFDNIFSLSLSISLSISLNLYLYISLFLSFSLDTHISSLLQPCIVYLHFLRLTRNSMPFKHNIDLINANSMFTHDNFNSMHTYSKLLLKLEHIILRIPSIEDNNRHTQNLLMMIFLMSLIPFSMRL